MQCVVRGASQNIQHAKLNLLPSLEMHAEFEHFLIQ
jgi:hypothetical protein